MCIYKLVAPTSSKSRNTLEPRNLFGIHGFVETFGADPSRVLDVFVWGGQQKISRGYVKGNLTYNLLITFRHIKMEAKKRMVANGMKIWMEGSFTGYRFYTLKILAAHQHVALKKKSLGEKTPIRSSEFSITASTTHFFCQRMTSKFCWKTRITSDFWHPWVSGVTRIGFMKGLM